ncbi:MAG TPA: glutathione S-transferase family protein [Acetobacteraceae bacterium]|nr:glutathione S-transferase family protein [Acetobacteraceae bacterium]
MPPSTVVWHANGSCGMDPSPAQTAPPLALWGVGTARALRVHWMLTELGLTYRSYRIQSRTGETMTPEYLRLNPRHKIPLLQHDGLSLTESAAIIQYLSERFPVPATFCAPTDAVSRAKVFEWCYFIINELDGHTLYVIRRHVGLKHIYGEAPAAVESAKVYCREQIEALAPRFDATNGHYLLGEQISVADILLTTCLDWALSAGIPLPEAVHAYLDRIHQRPAFQEALRRNDPSTPPLLEKRNA